MADVITDWTDATAQAKGPVVSHDMLAGLARRIDDALHVATKRLSEMTEERQELQDRVNRLHMAKRTIDELKGNAFDLEAIEQLASADLQPLTKKKKGNG